MAIESYRHRGRPDFYATSKWYLDDQETDNFLTVLERGEISDYEVQNVYENMKHNLALLQSKKKENLTGQEENEIKIIQEALKKVFPFLRAVKRKEPRDLGEIG